MNKLNKFLVLYKGIKLVFALLVFGWISQINAQEKIPFDQGVKYILADVNVVGKISFNKQTVVTFAGLEKGQDITIPGEEISNSIKKLGKLGLFSEIDFFVTKIAGDSIYLELNINELPKLSEVKFAGIKKKKTEALIKEGAALDRRCPQEDRIDLQTHRAVVPPAHSRELGQWRGLPATAFQDVRALRLFVPYLDSLCLDCLSVKSHADNSACTSAHSDDTNSAAGRTLVMPSTLVPA